MFSKISSNILIFLYIFLISIQSILTLSCYECTSNCTDISSCTCNQKINVDEKYYYCILLRETLTTGNFIEIRHLPKNLTDYYIYNPHYISVTETIAFNSTNDEWFSTSHKIAYGCQIDDCNHDYLLKELPSNGLSLMLPKDWLNETLLRRVSGVPTLCRTCNVEKICGQSPDSMNLSNICQRHECQGSCITNKILEDAETSQFCYGSICTDDTPIGPEGKSSEITINGIYYINKQEFELIEIDVICNGDDCSRLDLFTDIKQKLQKDLNNIKVFLTNSINSIYSTSFIFLIIILFLQIFIFY